MITRRRMIHNLVDMVASGIAPLQITNARELIGVKLFGKCEQRNDLPPGYTELEYIEGTGTQYIDTGIVPADKKIGAVVDFQSTSTTTSTSGVFGSNSQDNVNNIQFTVFQSKWRYKINDFSTYGSVYDTNRHTVSLNMIDGTKLDGNVVTSTQYTIASTNTQNCFLGACNYNGVPTTSGQMYTLIGKIYSAKVYDDTILVRNFISCRRNSDNVLGMYDTVTGTFFTNQGTGTFIAGPDVVPTPDKPMNIWCNNGVLKARHQSGLPLGYTLLDYIESNGTQYINLGISGNGNIVIDAQGTDVGTTSQSCILFGTSDGSAGTWYGRYATYTKWSIGPSGTCITTIPFTNRATATLSFSSTGIDGYVDDENISRIVYVSQGSWTLFASNNMLYPFYGRVFSFKGYKNNVMVRHLLPVKQLSDNIIGMYDLISGQFFTNAGTGDFIAGNEVSDPIEIYTEDTVETIDVTGNLVDFNEIRINSSTWDSADKTKGFEVYADIYQKSVGDFMLTNGNTFGIFVPCKQGESISLDFFDYIPDYARCLYCEITADRKCNTTPQAYAAYGVGITQKTFTLTQSNSIGFVIEWFINAAQTRNYTKQNYTVIKGQTPPTSYIPYFNGGTATATNLLQVGDYKDIQDIISGDVTRRVGVLVLNGSEDWQRQTEQHTTCINLYLQLTNNALIRGSIISNIATYYSNAGNGNDLKVNVGRINNSGKNLLLDLSLSDFSSVTAFTTYLSQQYAAGTPVIVLYPLATETTESVTPQTLAIQPGTNVFEITQASLDDLSMEVNYKGIR